MVSIVKHCMFTSQKFNKYFTNHLNSSDLWYLYLHQFAGDAKALAAIICTVCTECMDVLYITYGTSMNLLVV